MLKEENTHKTFFQLIRLGLGFGTSEDVKIPEGVDWEEVYRLAEEQSVLGLALAGIENLRNQGITEGMPNQMLLLQMIGEVQMVEQRNKAMNEFIARTVEDMRKKNIYTVLVKGQGLAQCYERPLWRPAGDIDFFFSQNDFPTATEYFRNIGGEVVQNARYTKSFGVVIEPLFIEVHGTLRNSLSSKMDREIDAVQKDVFYGGNVRSWQNGETTVFLPNVDNDVFPVFVHFVRHFYKGGVSLRQLCDWCRLLYRYHEELDVRLLENRIRRSGLMEEGRAFYTMANKYLGMPDVFQGAGFKFHDSRYERKAERILEYILAGSVEDGSFGQKVKSVRRLVKIFPKNTLAFLPMLFLNVNWMKVKERLGWGG